MKKYIHFAVKLLTLLLPAVLFFACSDLDSDTGSSSGGEAYVRVRSGSIARTVLPQANTLSDFTLKGKNGSAETVTLASADTLEELSEKVITVREGSWLFTLSAHCNGVLFSGEVSKNIEAGTTTSLSFLLITDAAYGGFSVTVSFEENAVLATGSLTSENGSPALAETELEITASSEGGVQKNQVTFARAFTADEGIAAGTYRATIRFYADTEKAIPLCTYTEIIRIAGGYQSLAERFLSLDETYSIEYDDDGGSLQGGESKATLFSRKSIVQLPRMKKENAYFRGWYDNAAFSGSPVTEIPAGTTGNQHLYAKYQPAEMYVSGTGDDVAGDGSEDNPFESLDKTCEEIITITEAETDSGIMDWTIFIMGDVTGPHEGTNKAGSRTYSKDYGRSIVPASLTLDHAKSLLIEGHTGLDTDATPQDKINRGLSGTSGSPDGTALVIETEVPVRLKNIFITNGVNKSSNGSTDPYHKKGGGLSIAEGATVTLGDGVLIDKNTAGNGAGIYNLGKLFIYGNVIIGRETEGKSVYQEPGNSGEDGGGICNAGKVYLGYSSYSDKNDNSPEEWTGCIQYNYSWRGGAIKNLSGATLVMNSGRIAYNEAANNSNAYGAGIYNLGTFLMTGGYIENNSTEGSNGGGVYNAYSDSTTYGTFTFTGGTIRNNYAKSGYGVAGDGGGVYNNGIMYVYGDALIGDNSKTLRASGGPAGSGCSNLADGSGGGIYVAANGKLYMGYSSYSDENDNTPALWEKGICYNYANAGSSHGGGGLGMASNSVVIFNSGTIENNGAVQYGRAVDFSCGRNGNFTLSGSATIPAGAGDYKQNIYYGVVASIKIASSLSHLVENPIYIMPKTNDAKTEYLYSDSATIDPAIALTDGAKEAGLTIPDVKDYFVVDDLEAVATGFVTHWMLNDVGKVVQNIGTFYVASEAKGASDDNDGLTATSPLATIAAAVAKMTDSNVDYTIILDGEILGPQVIQNPQANTIKIKGKSETSISSVPVDIINANLEPDEEGSALSIETDVPVTLYDIAVKGGHGQLCKDDGDDLDTNRTCGGGLFLIDGAIVSLEQNTRIFGNTACIEDLAGWFLYGCGGGVYVAASAKLYVDSKSHITENISSHYGAGIYVAKYGYLRIQKDSGAYITLNTFDKEYRDFTINSLPPCGGGVYLADNAEFEMFGAYIRSNESEDVLGSGVYVNSQSAMSISGAAEVTVPNDVYIKNGGQIMIAAGISASLAARLTPESYPADGDDPLYLLYLNPDSSSLYWSSFSNKFEVTPQVLAGGESQYWAIDTSNEGALAKKTGAMVSVVIPTGLSNDIEVTVTSDGVPVSADTKIPVSSNLVFTATEGMSSYTWTLDGEEVNKASPAAHIYSPDTSSWIKGSYVVYLEAKDSEGKYYSYTAQITVSE